ncbi:sugar phosphate isomerase/epimerase [Microvirga sp. BT688]|uniref:sugar phosphate isomerase/epimerase family protein n=1 Tax=Microvirga sp. TaxID=1873136 RepID=UPI001689AD45|nr:sugar phosphate isomerase/epimerase family protein [Microvirga sp.]MBD2750024.1 sugar phosphate isomerase/epimerase [Microvirga sp.]
MGAVPAQYRQLSVSNIAWPSDQDDEALEVVRDLGFDGVELAPAKVFGDIHSVPLEIVRTYRRKIEDKGLLVSALQAILFGVQGAHLFESSETRERMAVHLGRVAEIAGALGARACVFGSPTLRDPGSLPIATALEIAVTFFQRVAPHFASQGVDLCFEANPPLYQCRFVTRTQEAFDLVERVNMPGVAMQLDTGTIFANGEDPGIIQQVEHRIGHFHVSEPNLMPTGATGVDHAAVAEVLQNSTYPHWISIEMRAAGDWIRDLQRAYALAHSLYRGTRTTT